MRTPCRRVQAGLLDLSMIRWMEEILYHLLRIRKLVIGYIRRCKISFIFSRGLVRVCACVWGEGEQSIHNHAHNSRDGYHFLTCHPCSPP